MNIESRSIESWSAKSWKVPAWNVRPLLEPRVVVAAVGLTAMLTVVGGITSHRERKRLAAVTAQQAGAVAVLEQRISEPSVTTTRLSTDPTNQASPLDSSPSNSLERITRVQSFARVLGVFRSKGIRCVAADSVDASPDDLGTDQSTHRITLSGDFFRVQEALMTIHEDQPHALLTQWSMKRADVAEPCVWELAFCFSEVIP